MNDINTANSDFLDVVHDHRLLLSLFRLGLLMLESHRNHNLEVAKKCGGRGGHGDQEVVQNARAVLAGKDPARGVERGMRGFPDRRYFILVRRCEWNDNVEFWAVLTSLGTLVMRLSGLTLSWPFSGSRFCYLLKERSTSYSAAT